MKISRLPLPGSILSPFLCLQLAQLAVVVPVAADSLPTRKAGMWAISMSSPQGVLKQCVDAATDKQMQDVSFSLVGKMGGKCGAQTFEKREKSYVGLLECQLAGSTLTTKSTFTGDFNTSYSAEVTTSSEPPFLGQKSTTVKIAGKYLGPCTKDLKPGDVILPNGDKINNDTLGAQLKGAEQLLKSPLVQGALEDAVKSIDTKQIDTKHIDALQNALEGLKQKRKIDPTAANGSKISD